MIDVTDDVVWALDYVLSNNMNFEKGAYVNIGENWIRFWDAIMCRYVLINFKHELYFIIDSDAYAIAPGMNLLNLCFDISVYPIFFNMHISEIIASLKSPLNINCFSYITKNFDPQISEEMKNFILKNVDIFSTQYLANSNQGNDVFCFKIQDLIEANNC